MRLFICAAVFALIPAFCCATSSSTHVKRRKDTSRNLTYDCTSKGSSSRRFLRHRCKTRRTKSQTSNATTSSQRSSNSGGFSSVLYGALASIATLAGLYYIIEKNVPAKIAQIILSFRKHGNEEGNDYGPEYDKFDQGGRVDVLEKSGGIKPKSEVEKKVDKADERYLKLAAHNESMFLKEQNSGFYKEVDSGFLREKDSGFYKEMDSKEKDDVVAKAKGDDVAKQKDANEAQQKDANVAEEEDSEKESVVKKEDTGVFWGLFSTKEKEPEEPKEPERHVPW